MSLVIRSESRSTEIKEAKIEEQYILWERKEV
jgi:hypothetical protein